jgi:anti-anti-sigma regulatory factor
MVGPHLRRPGGDLVVRADPGEDHVAEPTTVEDLQPGDHACLTFSDADERLDIVAAFVRDGLDEGAGVMCLTDVLEPVGLARELAERGLAVDAPLGSGQLEILPSTDAFVTIGTFEAGRVIDGLRQRIKRASHQGYGGLRIAADMCWALRPVAGLEQLVSFETELTRLLADGRATAVCQYDRHCFDAVTLAGVTAAHNRAVAAVTYYHDAVLRICRQHLPPGLRIAGELDYRALDVLHLALGEAVRLDEHLFVNMAQLRFIDAASAGALLQATLALRNGQRMTVVCQPSVGKVLQALGAEQLPSLRLVVRNVG